MVNQHACRRPSVSAPGWPCGSAHRRPTVHVPWWSSPHGDGLVRVIQRHMGGTTNGLDIGANTGQSGPVQGPASQSRLLICVVLLGLLIVASPFVVRWAAQDWNRDWVVVVCGPAVPVLSFVGLTLWQERRATPRMSSFAGRPLSAAAYLMSLWVLGGCILGVWVVVLGAILLPLCAALVALAWVQPREHDAPWTVVLAIAATPFLVWFAGRADEYLNEAVLAGGVIAIIVMLLGRMRRRGNRRSVATTT